MHQMKKLFSNHHHHHLLYFPFIHQQVQPKDVETVTMYCTMYLLKHKCQMRKYNHNAMIAHAKSNYIMKSLQSQSSTKNKCTIPIADVI
jgi:hypothetical protein